MNVATPAPEIIPPADSTAEPWLAMPSGDYAIVELFGHTTLVGRITEVERFGAKMLALEPLFSGQVLAAVFHGGAAIYRLTPCTAKTAWERQHKEAWSLPVSMRTLVPDAALPAPYTASAADGDGGDEGDDEEGRPF